MDGIIRHWLRAVDSRSTLKSYTTLFIEQSPSTIQESFVSRWFCQLHDQFYYVHNRNRKKMCNKKSKHKSHWPIPEKTRISILESTSPVSKQFSKLGGNIYNQIRSINTALEIDFDRTSWNERGISILWRFGISIYNQNSIIQTTF